MDIELYSYWRSSASWRVRIALALKGLPYRTSPVHLVRDGGEQHADRYRALNPMREVPTLLVDGVAIAQSAAILEFLEERFPEPALLPGDAHQRAHARRLFEIVNSSIQPLQNLRVLQYVDSTFQVGSAGRADWARYWISLGLDGLEPVLSSRAGRHAVSDTVSIADLAIVPQVYNARRFDLDMARWPCIARVDAAASEHPAFVAAHPDRQPDAPEALGTS
ncbi:MAG: maleylacetoacetate isomerase [Deltaproteobacteria bacterium]|nr:MAG: maleylacetoacetate isomerase [Deltaproteobacteria bacterium]